MIALELHYRPAWHACQVHVKEAPNQEAADGTSIWVVNAGSSDKVFKYTLAGALLGSWTIDAGNANPTGITLDPTSVNHLWIVDSGTDWVYRYDDAASRTSGSQSAAAIFALASGNTNPQGIADPPPVGQASSLTGLAVDAALDTEEVAEAELALASLAGTAEDHDAALLSILAEFEQVWARPKRRMGIVTV